MDDRELDLSPALDVLDEDGVSLELVSLDGEVAHLTMHLVDPECADCVLPREYLEPVVLELLRTSRPSLRTVHISDPREHQP